MFNSAVKESAYIEDFVKENPYPNYKDMCEKIKTNLQLWCEYGKPNHEWCKTIYENATNKAIIKEMGENINKRGGMQAMVMNYYILKDHSPFSKSNHYVINCWAHSYVEFSWDGIGDFKA